MAYEKQTWQTGDTVTAAKLNHMEDGIAGGGTGGGVVYIDCTHTIDGGGVDAWTNPTIPFADAVTAYEAGSMLCLRFVDDGFATIMHISGALTEDGGITGLVFFEPSWPLGLLFASDGITKAEG